MSAAQGRAFLDEAAQEMGLPISDIANINTPYVPDINNTVNRLALLTTIEYEQVRKKEAKALDIRVEALDKVVREEKGEPEEKEGSGHAIKLYEPEPWDSPVNGAEVLDEAYNVIMRHMVIRRDDAIACVLWAVHAHLYDIFDHTPRLLITAPDAECGKTLLMAHIVGNLVTRPQPVELMKPAPFFRLAESLKPTFLIDEMDVFIQEDSDLLAAVNSGWEPHGGVPRCVGEDNEVRIFSTHCPVAMAGVELNKKLPDTTITRSVVISLERAVYEDIPDEDIYNAKQHKQVLIDIGRKIARWSLDHRDEVSEVAPCLPPKIRNRLADKWIPLFKIANVVGGEWPKHAKAALFGQVDMSEPTKAMMLLEDIRKVMDSDEDRISTKDMISRLCKMEDAPWCDYNFRASDRENRHISDRQVSNLLKKYNIHPKNVRMGKKIPKGYDLAALQNAWNRYLPVDTPIQDATTLQSSKHKAFKQSTNATKDNDVADKPSLKPAPDKGCSAVAAENRGIGDSEGIPHENTQEVTILIESILDELGKPVSVDMVMGELATDDYQYLINDPNYARGFVKTLLERLVP